MAVQVAPHRYVVWVDGGVDEESASRVRHDMDAVCAEDPLARFVVFGGGDQAASAIALATQVGAVDLVVTVDSPRSALCRVPAPVSVVDLARADDPSAVLAGLIGATDPQRTAVFY